MIGTLILIAMGLVLLGLIIYGICNDEEGCVISGVFFLIIYLVIMVLVYDGGLSAVASEEANQQCISRGYDTYDSYHRKPFGTEAFGVKCNHIANKKEILGSDNIVAVVR